MHIASELDADPVRLADHGVARRRAEHRSNDARAFSFERHLPQSFNRRIGPHVPRPPLLSVFVQPGGNAASPATLSDARLTITRSLIVFGASRLYSIVNTTKSCKRQVRVC